MDSTTATDRSVDVLSTDSPSDDEVKVVVTGLVSADTAGIVETVVQVGILPVLVLYGVTTNVIDMAVFRKQGFDDRINITLFSLALSDSGYLLLLFSSRLYSVLTLVDPVLGQYWKARSLVFIGLYAAFLNVSNILTLLISLDRCFCVVQPLKAKSLISARNSARLIVAVFAVCLVCCAPASFKYDVIVYVNPADNVTNYGSALTPFYRRHRDVMDGLYQFAMNVAVPTVSLLGVMAATSIIAVYMRRSLTWRRQAGMHQSTAFITAATDRRELAVTRMLVVVCVVFTICTIPAVTLSFVRNLVPGFLPSGRYTHAFYISNCLMHLLSSVNCSINFLIYCLMGSRFRATLRQLLCGILRSRKRRRQEGDGGANVFSSFSGSFYGSGSHGGGSVRVSVVSGNGPYGAQKNDAF